MPRVRTLALVVTAVLAMAGAASAQVHTAVVLDQAEQPLPGATVSLVRGSTIVATTVTNADGTFSFAGVQPTDVLEVSLGGFQTVRVLVAGAARITLKLSRAIETIVRPQPTAVVAPNSPVLGGGVTSETVARMPSSAQMKARESLPLLPSVVRGPDGLLHVGGASAYDTPVSLDGFNVTDPATGLSSLNLPYEMVRNVTVVRDPMNVTYGGLLAGVTAMESRPGTDTWRFGVQGVVPRPRFETPGFGRIEGIFPRAYASGSSGEGRTQYATAVEFDYERFAVPGVTTGRGPDSVDRALTWFGRLDHQWRDGQSTTVEAVIFPGAREAFGLSPRRAKAATLDIAATDRFVGIIHRSASKSGALLTWRMSGVVHDMTATPNGEGPSVSTPLGWRDNWFNRADRVTTRLAMSVGWERAVRIGKRTHELGVAGELASRKLRGHLTDGPVHVLDGNGRLARHVQFGAPVSIGARDVPMAAAARDLWHALPRLDIEAGTRVDYSRYGGAVPSGRAGLRVALDESESTVLKAGYGSFVGALPLAVPAFAAYPTRIDRSWEPETGDLISEIELRPHVGAIQQPRAVAATISLERQLRPGLVAQVGLTDRRSSRLPTLEVPSESGLLTAASTGSGHYRELQFAAQRTWGESQQVFASYVLSSTYGELNDFTTQLGGLDAPLLQRGGYARVTTDARHRLVTWGTVNLPKGFVVSPAVEWHTGFRYSALDVQQRYLDAPNARLFPTFFAADMVVYKTVTVKQRTADLGVQLFNMTRHANPRDVYPVAGTPLSGTFTNSVGLVVRGYMLVKW
ncbi:MAG TPA: TonB-dependent receptor [Vicinamibacterales bacterium]|nr:TonB-dependent receptor [Vicinamibacterales bacterium]